MILAEELMQKYSEFLKETASKNTAASYMADLRKFVAYMDIVTVKEMAKVTEKDIEDYIQLLTKEGKAYSSIARMTASLKKFFEYCVEIGVMPKNPAGKVEAPQVKRKLPATLTTEQVVKLLEAPDDTTDKGIRDRAMLEIMYASGARVSEMISLAVSDVSMKNETVSLFSSGKRRSVPLGRAAMDALTRYIKEARPKIVNADKTDVLFLNAHGVPLSRQGFWKIIKTYIGEAGIRGDVTAQTLRHCFALHLLENGADAGSVSEMLGYSSIAPPRIYTDIIDSRIKKVYKEAHPRA